MALLLLWVGKRQVISGERNGRHLIGATTPGEKDSLTLRATKHGAKSAPMKIGISAKATQKRRRVTTRWIGATLNVGSALLGALCLAKIIERKNPKGLQSTKPQLNVVLDR
jgi:hypothetical protein